MHIVQERWAAQDLIFSTLLSSNIATLKVRLGCDSQFLTVLSVFYFAIAVHKHLCDCHVAVILLELSA